MRKGIKFLFIPLVYASNQTPSPHRVVHPFIFDLRATSSYPFQYSISHKRENGRNTHLNRGLFALFGKDSLCSVPEVYTTIWGEVYSALQKNSSTPRQSLFADMRRYKKHMIGAAILYLSGVFFFAKLIFPLYLTHPNGIIGIGSITAIVLCNNVFSVFTPGRYGF